MKKVSYNGQIKNRRGLLVIDEEACVSSKTLQDHTRVKTRHATRTSRLFQCFSNDWTSSSDQYRMNRNDYQYLLLHKPSNTQIVQSTPAELPLTED